MCGITGYLDFDRASSEQELHTTATAMAATLEHRGPDDSGTWVDPRAGIALASRRLAIIELSELGKQPMVSSCGRYVLAFNGEIYNFRELRRKLEKNGRRFAGGSDTEVLVEAVSEWGFTHAVAESNGMFAIAVWDRRERKVLLARDRLGEKPLYYGWIESHFFFASETRALRAHPAFSGGIDREAASLFLRHNYVPAPWSIHQGVKKLPPGTILEVDADRSSAQAPSPFWSLTNTVEHGCANRLVVGRAEAEQMLDELLRDAVAMRMIADVPLGAFLSGGIDSSTIVALMQSVSSRPVRTFTIGFHDKTHDEASNAAAVAHHLGTDHTELYVDERDLLDTVPRLATVYDEPFADSSQIPTLLVSQLARDHVTVALSGDGGDELFGGYPRYVFAERYWRLARSTPESIRRFIGRAVKQVSVERWDRSFERVAKRFTSRTTRPGDKLHKFADVYEARDDIEMLARIHSFWQPTTPVLGSQDPRSPWEDEMRRANVPTVVEQMMQLDTDIYLPDDILAKVDRAAMSVSLETRIPLLDHRVVELAWQMPLEWKLHRGQTKGILRDVLHRYVPTSILDRPKMGFGVPLAQWLRGPLKEWAADLLSPAAVSASGLLDPTAITKRFDEHMSGRRDWKYDLWGAAMLMSWLSNVDTKRTTTVARRSEH